MEMGNNIKSARERLGITQRELAARIYVSQPTVGNWEVCRALPQTAIIPPLAEALGVSTDYLFYGGSK